MANAVQEDIAYTSFEADGKGGWNFNGSPVADNTAPTGTMSYPFGPEAISRNLDAAKTYIVSFWKKGLVNVSAGTLYRTGRTINGWTYVEYSVSNANNITISGNGNIDELRLHPKNAQMTSYTYEPLLGITSKSEEIRNHLKNLTDETYEYHCFCVTFFAFFPSYERYTMPKYSYRGIVSLIAIASVNQSFGLEIKLNYIRVWDPEKLPLTPIVSLHLSANFKQATTYFDGLGRSVQTVVKGNDPLGTRDIVRFTVYDEFDREVKQYLPYAPSSGSNGKFRVSPFAEQQAYYHTNCQDQTPYSIPAFEPSSLNLFLINYHAEGVKVEEIASEASSGRTFSQLLSFNTDTNNFKTTIIIDAVITLKVMAGDKVDLGIKVWYPGSNKASPLWAGIQAF